MSNEMKTSTAEKDHRARCLLESELDAIVARLQTEAEVPQASVAGSDFLDAAQDIESQELARLTALRLTERAKRLRIALARMSEGQYRVCSECGEPIPQRRLLAMPDAITCVACQERLERRGIPTGVSDDVRSPRARD